MDIVKKTILGILLGIFISTIIITVNLKTKEEKKISSQRMQNEIEFKITEAIKKASNDIAEKNIGNNEVKTNEIVDNKNRTFYLHKSKLEIPNSTKCYAAKDKALNGMNTNEVTKLQIVISDNQQYIEYVLGEMVSLLKDKDSKYWDAQTNTGVFTDPVSGEKSTRWS